MIRLDVIEKDRRVRVSDDDKLLGLATREQRGFGDARKRHWVVVIEGTLFEGPNLETLQHVLEDHYNYPRTSFKVKGYATRTNNRKGERRGAYHGRKYG